MGSLTWWDVWWLKSDHHENLLKYISGEKMKATSLKGPLKHHKNYQILTNLTNWWFPNDSANWKSNFFLIAFYCLVTIFNPLITLPLNIFITAFKFLMNTLTMNKFYMAKNSFTINNGCRVRGVLMFEMKHCLTTQLKNYKSIKPTQWVTSKCRIPCWFPQ